MAILKSLGHSCFTLTSDGYEIVFDPWLTDNPDAICGPEDMAPGAILVSHGHSDHLGDAIEISNRSGAPIIAPYELAMYCARHGCDVRPMHIGGAAQYDFGRVKLTMATHGSAVVGDNLIEYTGVACGFVVTMGGVTVYYAGDTGLFGDMKLIGQLADLDVAVLPIGDNFTMGPEDATLAAELLRASVVVPMHYNAFDIIRQDAEAYAEGLRARGIGCEVIAPGEELSI